jgi:hypothetical protein
MISSGLVMMGTDNDKIRNQVCENLESRDLQRTPRHASCRGEFEVIAGTALNTRTTRRYSGVLLAYVYDSCRF